MTEEYDFNKADKMFNDAAVAIEEVAKLISPMYKAYRKEGLSEREAAALTVAFVAQMPAPPPQEGT